MLKFKSPKIIDVAVIGGGPAGLTVSLYLARFLRSVVVMDSGDARAKLIPRTHNCPGFPQGLAGDVLLARLTEQTRTYDTDIVQAFVQGIEKQGDIFVLTTTAGMAQASNVVFATGVIDNTPDIARLRERIATGSVRLCPVCDGYEVRGKRIGVVGPQQRSLKEALFLKTFSSDVTILCSHPDDLSDFTRGQAAAAGLEIWDSVDDLIPAPTGFDVIMADGLATQTLDVVYPAMGCAVRSDLARHLGVECDDEGYIVVGRHMETSVRCVYAIGDVANGLNQIVVGFGHAALAATHIHNSLCEAEDRERVNVG